MSTVYGPDLHTQLGHGIPVPGRSRGSRDCGPQTVRTGIQRLTMGQLLPSVVEVRERMGKPGPQTTNTADAERCVESYDTEMRRLDRRPLEYLRLRGAQAEGMLRDAVKAGDAVQWAVDYGTFNQRMDFKTGDPNFVGTPALPAGHSFLTHGWDRRRVRGGRHWRVMWQLFDSLDDHRRAGIPDGPRWVRPGPILAAWADLGFYAGIFRGGEKTL